MSVRIRQSFLRILFSCWLGGCTTAVTAPSDLSSQSIAPVVGVHPICGSPSASAPRDTWLCPSDLSVDCASTTPIALAVTSPSDQTCVTDQLNASVSSFQSGVETVTIRDATGAELCSTAVTVIDHTPPVLEPQTIQLWPPNHKFHDISIDDCVTAHDACDGPIDAQFIWASSDEPVDDIGDGHFAPDIEFGDCQHVSVRSERQGPENGRVYKLGVRAVDRNGNASESVCEVIVDHDQRGVVGADSGEAYRLSFDGSQGTATCDGTQPPVAPPPVVTPPTAPPPPVVTPPTQPPPPAPGLSPV